MSAEEGWVHLLQKRLDKENKTFKVINMSISGMTTPKGIEILPGAIQENKPNIVVIELGGNDGLLGKPVKRISQNLASMIEMSQASGAKVLILGVRIPPNYGKRYTEPFFKQFASLAEKYNTGYLPFILEGIAGENELMMGDGIHPKASAQKMVLDNVWPYLTPLL